MDKFEEMVESSDFPIRFYFLFRELCKHVYVIVTFFFSIRFHCSLFSLQFRYTFVLRLLLNVIFLFRLAILEKGASISRLNLCL